MSVHDIATQHPVVFEEILKLGEVRAEFIARQSEKVRRKIRQRLEKNAHSQIA